MASALAASSVQYQLVRRRGGGSALTVTIASMASTSANSEQVGREYLRVSRDRTGQQRSPEEQHHDNARAAQARSWTLGKPYKDIGSASRYASRARKEFDALVADLQAGHFDANVLILWESSRGSRKVSEWVNLIELCERRNVRIYVTSDNKLYDPADPRDRRSLLEDSVDGEYEVAKTSKRSRRAHAAIAAEGKPSGPCPYGYTRTYNPLTRRFATQIVEPTEGKVIRELYKRLHAGHSLRSIATHFEAKGIRTRAGKPFGSQQLRTLALSQTYLGKRVHDPERKAGHKLSASAEITDGIWPALVDRKTFLAVQRRLTAPERVTTRPGRGTHLLSMNAGCICDMCGGKLDVRTSKAGHQRYRCHDKSCVFVPYDDLNQLVENTMIAWLSREDNRAWLAPPDNDTELNSVQEQIAEIRAELDDLADQVGRGELSATLAARAEPAIRSRLRVAETREAELSTPDALRGLIGTGKDVRRRWKAAPMSARREVVRLLLVPEVLGELKICRPPVRGGRCAIEERIVWRRQES